MALKIFFEFQGSAYNLPLNRTFDDYLMADITMLLQAWTRGDKAALNDLTPLVYEELHRMARGYMKRENTGRTLQTTALVHETYLRLVDVSKVGWKDRAHFFAVSAQMMRRILVDRVRARTSKKRGGHNRRIYLDQIPDVASGRQSELVAIDDALNILEEVHSRMARVTELPYFGGLSVEETAEVLNISPQSVMRDWRLAKAFLARELSRVGRES
jgi:RNA polymerase sigma-70 factor, ECF subfamily